MVISSCNGLLEEETARNLLVMSEILVQTREHFGEPKERTKFDRDPMYLNRKLNSKVT